jgi:60 kDa SS-A/Ro ribonucleoprotein
MALAYTTYYSPGTATPQSQPIPGREHHLVLNNAGGVGFILDDWEQLNRFLILGSVSGTYYVNERDLTKQNADIVIQCIKEDGPRVVALAQSINLANRAPKVDSQLFALALALKHGDTATKRAVYGAAQSMLRTGTHFLNFAAMLKSLGGWNRSKRGVLKAWFDQSGDKLGYQMLKYQRRS